MPRVVILSSLDLYETGLCIFSVSLLCLVAASYFQGKRISGYTSAACAGGLGRWMGCGSYITKALIRVYLLYAYVRSRCSSALRCSRASAPSMRCGSPRHGNGLTRILWVRVRVRVR